jgi:hypothetical protein
VIQEPKEGERTMTDLEIALKLRQAANGVRRGWWQCGDGVHEPGGHCAENWLMYPLEDLQFDYDAVPARVLLEARVGYVPRWNDEPGRTKEEVIALFEGLAADLELRHQIKSQPVEPDPVPVAAQV